VKNIEIDEEGNLIIMNIGEDGKEWIGKRKKFHVIVFKEGILISREKPKELTDEEKEFLNKVKNQDVASSKHIQEMYR
jgi:fructose-1,6-bisphosphatase